MSTAAVLSDFFTAALREARSERPASLASRIPALDELTEGGFPVNALTELFIPHAGIGEVRMLLPALASLKHVTWVLPCDSEAAPYAPALADAGLDLDRQLFSIPSTPEEAFWCAEQAAASGETSAVVVWLNPLVHGKDGAALARLDMAAHSTGTTIFLIRPSSMACTPSPAELRLMLRPGRSGTVHVRATRRGAFFDRTREADVSLEERPLVHTPRASRRNVQQAPAPVRLSPAC